MRTRPDPTDEFDAKELADLNAAPWQLRCLALNPSYPHWGPHEDYMIVKSGGWREPVSAKTWADFGPWSLDDMNELVHFYFEANRASKPCEACDQSGQNPATKQIADDFYDSGGTGRRWVDNITQDEVDVLVAAGRLCAQGKTPPTVAEVNAANRRPGIGGLCHDAINRCILVEARAKRLGVYGQCEACEGRGDIFTEPTAKLGLVLWIIHPRKGASRGVEVSEIQRGELPAVFAFLAEGARRNAERFAAVVAKRDAHAEEA